MLSPSVRAHGRVASHLYPYLQSVRTMQTVVKDRAVQCSPGGEEQGGGEVVWQVLSLESEGRDGAAMTGDVGYGIITFSCAMRLHQNDTAPMRRLYVYIERAECTMDVELERDTRWSDGRMPSVWMEQA